MVNKTIILTGIVIKSWAIDVRERKVSVEYEIDQDDETTYRLGGAVFWETLPTPTDPITGDPLPLPEHWHQLPAQYSQFLTDLTQDIRSALLYLIQE